MGYNSESTYALAIRARIRKILEFAGLEIAGMAELTGVSQSHIYAILNGRRALQEDVADRLGFKLKLSAWQILNLDYEITESIRKSALLNKFYNEHKGNPEYFTDTILERKDSYYVEQTLIPAGFFDNPVYVWEIREALSRYGREFSSKQVSRIVNYLAATGKLMSEKRPIKKKNGEYGIREVPVYYKPNKSV